MLNFDFLKVLGIVASPHFEYNFPKKCISFYILLTDKLHCLIAFTLDILGNMCTAMVCFPGCDVINFKINLNFLIKPFFYMAKKPRQKFKYLENEGSFYGEIKFFHHF